MGANIAVFGVMMVVLPIFGLFMGIGGELLILIPVGIVIAFVGAAIDADDQKRHTADYGNVTRCYKCGSTKVYAMTYDDKRASIAFWGAASSKIGKRYHCDNCGNEW